ncbi:hypothetical protein HY932_02775 [Candidatus Falkowbacteria bacterium]|nr:hypothetical protein [Candidatus Falkowbacteria bacterium]
MQSLFNRREYGVYVPGWNNIVFVGPHGGDPQEAALSGALVTLFEAGCGIVINEKIPRGTVDLNNAGAIRQCELAAAKQFLADVNAAAERTLKCADADCFVFFVHNAEKNFVTDGKTFPRVNGDEQVVEAVHVSGQDRPYHLDIGAGVTWLKARFDDFNLGDILEAIEQEFHPCEGSSLLQWMPAAKDTWPERGKGKVTCPRDYLLQLVGIAQQLRLNWKVEIGKEFAAQRRSNMVQEIYRAHRKSKRLFCVQLEFLDALPIKDVLLYITQLIEMFKNFGLEEWEDFAIPLA